MPIFYLHAVCGGEVILDEEGIDYADVAAAEREAVKGARSIISAEVLGGRLRLDESIEVHDAEGRHLSTIRFSDVLEIVPAAGTARRSAAGDQG